MRVLFCLGLVALAACGGAQSTDLTASIAQAGAASVTAEIAVAGSGSIAASSGGSAGFVSISAGAPGAAAGTGGASVAGAAGTDQSPAGSSTGGGSVGGAAAASGGNAGSSAGSDSVAGSDAGGAVNAACAPSNTHALPVSCSPVGPVICTNPVLDSWGGCIGNGECSDLPGSHCVGMSEQVWTSEGPNGPIQTPGDDWAVCRDGRHASCPHGTCGTSSGSGCVTYQSDVVYPPEFCPCEDLGGITKD